HIRAHSVQDGHPNQDEEGRQKAEGKMKPAALPSNRLPEMIVGVKGEELQKEGGDGEINRGAELIEHPAVRQGEESHEELDHQDRQDGADRKGHQGKPAEPPGDVGVEGMTPIDRLKERGDEHEADRQARQRDVKEAEEGDGNAVPQQGKMSRSEFLQNLRQSATPYRAGLFRLRTI